MGYRKARMSAGWHIFWKLWGTDPWAFVGMWLAAMLLSLILDTALDLIRELLRGWV